MLPGRTSSSSHEVCWFEACFADSNETFLTVEMESKIILDWLILDGIFQTVRVYAYVVYQDTPWNIWLTSFLLVFVIIIINNIINYIFRRIDYLLKEYSVVVKDLLLSLLNKKETFCIHSYISLGP